VPSTKKYPLDPRRRLRRECSMGGHYRPHPMGLHQYTLLPPSEVRSPRRNIQVLRCPTAAFKSCSPPNDSCHSPFCSIACFFPFTNFTRAIFCPVFFSFFLRFCTWDRKWYMLSMSPAQYMALGTVFSAVRNRDFPSAGH
jgi:hypothetical protein